jgi:signal transduction histidine kinase
MGLRHRSIRLRIGILIVVPVLCLIALYGFAASITLGDALSQAHAKSLRAELLQPLTTFQTQLDKERHLAVLSLASPGSTRMAYGLSQQEAATQQALSALKQDLAAPKIMDAASPAERHLINVLNAATTRLSAIRTNVAASAITIAQALTAYSTMIDDAYLVLDAAMEQQSNVPLATQALDVIALDQVAQTTLEESDLLAADIARGQFPEADRVFFAQLASDRRMGLANTLPLLDPAYHKLISTALTPALSTSLTNLETAVITTPWRHGPSAQIMAGTGVFQAYSGAIDGAIAQAALQLQTQAQNNANSIFAELILAAGLGLLGTIASIGLSVYIGRNLVRQLRGLRESALDLASEKLPRVISQLRDGQAVDLSEYAAPADTATKDEIEQVQQAFHIVQQTAVQSAVDEARLRRGISDVFRNLAGRSQSLLHRQLTLLDGMERRATEPDELEDLFRIDHLTTRMRRHAEGLIILSGEAPARGWRQPVPLIDVLRAAVAEVEDYTRVRVLSRTKAAVAGHAVADVIHLIAELAENATVFSPPNTPVRIQGDIVGRGFAVEIEDRGLGISPERLAEINSNLANPPQFDLSDSDRLGLFITGQLARRHDIAVTLQPSVYGGTTAVVLIPTALVVDEHSYDPDSALQGHGPAGRHAALAAAERGRLTSGNGHAASLPDGRPAPLPIGSTAADDIPSGTLISGIIPSEDVPPMRPTGDLPRRQPATDLPRRQPASEPAVLQLQPHASEPTAPGSGLSAPGSGLSAPGKDEPDARVTTEELAELGLPTRVRQASLAPQLRDSSPARTVAAETSETTSSPEAARSTVSALQRGWLLGRAEASAELPDPPADPRKTDYDVFSRPPADQKPASPAGRGPDDADEQ